jgi:hypothetical protein
LTEAFPPYYNHERPHQGRACANRTPDEAFPELPALPHLPETVQPDAWLQAYHGRVYRRRVSAAGTIQIDRYLYSVGTAYARQPVLVHLDTEEKTFFVSWGEKLLKRLPIQGLYGAEMDFSSYLIAMKAEARTIDYHHQLHWEKIGDLAWSLRFKPLLVSGWNPPVLALPCQEPFERAFESGKKAKILILSVLFPVKAIEKQRICVGDDPRASEAGIKLQFRTTTGKVSLKFSSLFVSHVLTFYRLII